MKTTNPLPVAVLLSGTGRTLVNLVSRVAAGTLDLDIRTVIGSEAGLVGLQRAHEHDLPTRVVDPRDHDGDAALSEAVFDHVRHAGASHVVLAGFLRKLVIPSEFRYRVLNIHPALLPSFGGYGMYGRRVHQAVLHAGCKVSGCTVHFCDDQYDTGPIIVQRACVVKDDDTPEALAERVFEQECLAYPDALQRLAEDRIRLVDGVVRCQGFETGGAVAG